MKSFVGSEVTIDMTCTVLDRYDTMIQIVDLVDSSKITVKYLKNRKLLYDYVSNLIFISNKLYNDEEFNSKYLSGDKKDTVKHNRLLANSIDKLSDDLSVKYEYHMSCSTNKNRYVRHINGLVKNICEYLVAVLGESPRSILEVNEYYSILSNIITNYNNKIKQLDMEDE